MTFKCISIITLIFFLSACAAVKQDRPKEKEKIDDSDIVRFTAEVLPLFGACTDQACSDKKLIEYIYNNLKYPVEARKQRIQGKVYIQYVIEKDGYMSNVVLIKDLEAGCGEAALRVVNAMNELDQPPWSPGKQKGKKVRVKYTLPITFKL